MRATFLHRIQVKLRKQRLILDLIRCGMSAMHRADIKHVIRGEERLIGEQATREPQPARN